MDYTELPLDRKLYAYETMVISEFDLSSFVLFRKQKSCRERMKDGKS